jgi:hypothetical protein
MSLASAQARYNYYKGVLAQYNAINDNGNVTDVRTLKKRDDLTPEDRDKIAEAKKRFRAARDDVCRFTHAEQNPDYKEFLSSRDRARKMRRDQSETPSEYEARRARERVNEAKYDAKRYKKDND